MRETPLATRHCVNCTAGKAPLTRERIDDLLLQVPGWTLSPDATRLNRIWRVKDFLTALDIFRRIGDVAEAEDHHPDLHLTSYRNITVELWTHAAGGLTENDFILAAKISEVMSGSQGNGSTIGD